jgi:type II secretory ATPase GspE/PulE/Tfp pilus assembly ATPase PilB-like protein
MAIVGLTALLALLAMTTAALAAGPTAVSTAAPAPAVTPTATAAHPTATAAHPPAPVATPSAAAAAPSSTAPAAATITQDMYYSPGLEAPRLHDPRLLAFNPLKFIPVLAFALGVCYLLNWTVKDTMLLEINQDLWVGLVLGGGLAGLAAAALVPLFYVGFPLGLLIFGGTALAYAQHRNALVPTPQKVLTKDHWERLRAGKPTGRTDVNRGGAGFVVGTGRDIVFMGMDDLPIRLQARTDAEREAAAEIERLLFTGIARRATSIGVVARQGKGFEVRFSIDGRIVAGGDIEHPAAEAFPTTIKQMAGLDVAEVRRPQEGRIRAVAGGRNYELRIRTSGTVRGEQTAVRIIDLAASQRRLEDLGLADVEREALKESLTHQPGLVVVSAPKDSGLTTTLHACLRQFDRYTNNIIVFEPHPDLEIDNIQHIAIDQQNEAAALAEMKSRLRMAPDVIAFDSLVLPSAAQALMDAAQEHTILVGLRAVDATQALARLATLVPGHDTMAQRLQMVVNQRLVRKLCPTCKEAYRPNPDFIRKANFGNQRVDVLYRPPSKSPKDKDGKPIVCPDCHDERYSGRTGLFELMPLDDEARGLFAGGATPADLRTHARKIGMRNLQEEGLRLVAAGVTSIEEVLRVIKQES